jgi:hypothetical protein
MNNRTTIFICFLLLMALNAISQSCHPKDSLALIQLRDATNANNWNTITNLNGGTPWTGVNPASWFGIETIPDPILPNIYRIAKINLDGVNFNAVGTSYLAGNLPPGLFNDSALLYLDTLMLANNEIANTTGALKNANASISPAPTLRYWDLSNNLLDPSNVNLLSELLGNFSNLVSFSGNSMLDNGAIPLTNFDTYLLPNLVTLEVLRLNNNNLNGLLDIDTLTSTQHCPNLIELYADTNHFQQIKAINGQTITFKVLSVNENDLQEFSDLKDLMESYEHIFVSLYGHSVMDTSIHDTFKLDFSKKIDKLKNLILPHNNLVGELPLELFENFKKIEKIHLNNNLLTGKMPRPLDSYLVAGVLVYTYDNLNKLEELVLNDNQLRGAFRFDWILGDQAKGTFGSAGLNAKLKHLNIANNYYKKILPQLDDDFSATMLGTYFSLRFANFEHLNVSNNRLDFKDLFRLQRIFRMKQVNLLGTDHFIPQSGLTDNDFLYSPQDSIGIGGLKRRAPGDSLVMDAGEDIIEPEQNSINVLSNEYFWEQVDPVGAFSTVGTVQVNGTFSGPGGTGLFPADGALGDSTHMHQMGVRNLDSTAHHNQRLTAMITNDSFPNLVLFMKQKKIEVGYCLDSSGAKIQCQTMIVQFHPDTLAQYPSEKQDSFKAAIAESIGAKTLDKCLCGDMELWEISDTATLMLEGFGKGTKRSAKRASIKPELLSADANYALLDADTTSLPNDSLAIQQGEGNTTAKTIVAIIDSGVDFAYTPLKSYISEGLSAADVDSCMAGAFWGFNFLGQNNNPTDNHGHGTAVAGIIAGLSQNNMLPDTGSFSDGLAILPLKYTNDGGQGTLFNASCGLYYAANYWRLTSNNDTARVRVINNSWGYYGDPSTVLENTFQYVGDECGILIVCSAGNDGRLIQGSDSAQHWPSNSIYDPMDIIPADNVIAVAAVSSHNSNTLTPYSNYGNAHVDIAAQGTDISTEAGTTNGFSTVIGSSFATAQVARAAALLFDKYPDASYTAIKQALMQGTDKLQSSDSTKLVSGGRLNFQKADSLLNISPDRTICATHLLSDYNPPAVSTQELRIDLYPNPVCGDLNVYIEGLSSMQKTTLSVYNAQGQLFYQRGIQSDDYSISIPTNDLPAGIYFLQVNSGNNNCKKFIKQ